MQRIKVRCLHVSAIALIIGTVSIEAVAAGSSHVMHTQNRDEGLRGVEMTLDVVDALAERQKTVMDQSYRMQYENRGFDLKFLPEITYDTSTLTLGSGRTVGTSVFTIRSKNQSRETVDRAITLYGIKGATYHKIICNGVTNIFQDQACLGKAEEVFGRMGVTQ